MLAKTRRFSLIAAATVFVGVVGTALPAGAGAEDAAADMANASASIAAYNAGAISSEATAGPEEDDITCTIGYWGGGQTPRVQVPNTVTVHAQDVASADSDCSDIDPLPTPASFTSYLRVNFQYLIPGESGTADDDWVTYHSDRCLQPSFLGHSVIAQCTLQHGFEDPNDPIQLLVRRIQFNNGVMIDADTEGRVRSTRTFGPLVPKCKRFTDDDAPCAGGV